MTRTDVYKTLYFAKIAAIVALAVGAVLAGQSGRSAAAAALAVLAVLLLMSGRVQAAFWSELLAGLHHLNRRDYARSKAHSERFIAQLNKHPWLRRLSWLAPSSYTLNAEVMALNNLGAAEIALEAYSAAQAHLDRAIELDPKCPLPYRNRGLLALRTGPYLDAAPWFDKAHALGLRGDAGDRRAAASARNNAALSTEGLARTAPGSTPPQAPSNETPPHGAFVVELLDDDVAPFEFAVSTLERVFGMTGAQAMRIVLAAHDQGRAVCAAFDTEAEAEAKVAAVAALARSTGLPLACVSRPAV